jgi:hypothetical protein
LLFSLFGVGEYDSLAVELEEEFSAGLGAGYFYLEGL